jgi:HEAT repeat protein
VEHGGLQFSISGRAVVLLLLVLAVCLLSTGAKAQFACVTNAGGITITRYAGPGGAVTIPDTVDGFPVVGIASSAFWGCKELTDVTLPKSVTTIGGGVFSFCSNLRRINFPSGITSIGTSAFQECAALTSIALPESVTNLGNFAFAGCKSLTNVTIPSRIGSIERGVFSSCTRLRHVTLPSGLTNIGVYAFSGCDKLVAVMIPEGVISIADYAFSECSQLQGVTIPNSVRSIGNGAFSKCASLANMAIPDRVTSFGDWMFSGCKSLTSATIPRGVARIPCGTFSGCLALTNFTIPDRVTSIGNSAFGWCASLTTLAIPDGVTSIGDDAFRSCICLAGVTLPASLVMIGSAAFRDCGSLTNVTVPGRVTRIGNYAFFSCTNLTDVKIPSSVSDLGMDALVFRPNETNLTICRGVTNLGGVSLYYSYPRVNGTVTVWGDSRSSGAVNIPETICGRRVTTIGPSAFYLRTGLTSVTIPSGVTRIESMAFSGCSGLGGIVIPPGVTEIGRGAFASCTRLTNAVILGNITEIGDSVFKDCANLVDVTMPESITNIGDYAFALCPKLQRLTVPNGVTHVGEAAFDANTRLTNSVPAATTPVWESIENSHAVIGGSPEQKAALVRKLKQRPDPRLIRSLTGCLHDPQGSLAYPAAEVLSELNDGGPEVLEGFLNLLRSTNSPGLRRLGAIGIGNSGRSDPRAIPALADALADQWLSVQGATALALGKLGGPEAITALSKARQASRSLDFCRVADIVLVRMGDSNSVARVAALLRAPKLPDQQIRPKLAAISSNPTNTGLTLLTNMMQTVFEAILGVSVEVKLTAAATLGEFGGEVAVQALQKALKENGEPRVRAAAATALGEALGSNHRLVPPNVRDQAIASLTAAMQGDQEELVREKASRSLRMINHK